MMTWLLAAYLWLSLLVWAAVARGAWRLHSLPALTRCAGNKPARWPTLSVVVPACNEADTIEAALASLLAQDYPGLEIVLVEDRSGDGTGEIVDRMAAGDPRVLAIHLRELPAGWLGKVNALRRGLEASHGELVLFTDADVHFAAGALRSAVSFLESHHLDHLAAIPAFRPTGRLVDVIDADILRGLLTVVLPSWRVHDARSRQFFGVGAFNLLRQEALGRTAGLEWLRMETADDVGVGLLMRRSGGRCGVASAFDLVSLVWHHRLEDVMRGTEKVHATIGNCSLGRMVLMAAGAPLGGVSPLAGAGAAVWATSPGTRVVGGAVVAVFVLGTAVWAHFMRSHLLPGLLTPLLAPVPVAAILRAAWLGSRRGGITWRGTLYPCRELRARRRVRVPF